MKSIRIAFAALLTILLLPVLAAAQAFNGQIDKAPNLSLSKVLGVDSSGRVGLTPTTTFVPATSLPSGQLVGTTGVQTLDNKTLSSPTLTSPTITGTLNGNSLPVGPIVGTTDTQTLSNKTLTAPFINTINGNALPSGPIVGTTDTQTLTNKTFNGLQIVTPEDQNVSPKCVADGVTDCLPAFNAAMAKFSYAPLIRSGGEIRLNAGSYYVSAPVDMTGKYGLQVLGAGGISTQVVSKGNYPVFTASGTYASSLFGISIKNLNVVCGGKANANAHGVVWNYVNHGVIDDNLFFSCNKAIDVTGNFLTYITNNNITGQGSQQNNNCLTAEFPTDVNDTYGNNALIVSHNLCQNVSGNGFRLISANGSLFDHNQILAPGGKGVAACDQPATTYPSGAAANCEFMFFDQDQVDTTGGIGWEFKRGSGVAIGPSIVLHQPWAGLTQTAAFSIDGGTDISLLEAEIQTTDAGILLNNVTNSRVSGRISSYNNNNNSSGAVLFSGTTSGNTLDVNTKTSFPVSGTYNGITETGSYSANRIRGGVASCAIGLAFGGSSSGLTYIVGPATTNQCRYEVDGLTVRIQYYLSLSAMGASTGAATLTGLPITSGAAVGWGFGTVSGLLASNMNSNLTGPVLSQVVANGTTVNLVSQGAAGTVSLVNTNFTNTSTITGSLEYFKP